VTTLRIEHIYLFGTFQRVLTVFAFFLNKERSGAVGIWNIAAIRFGGWELKKLAPRKGVEEDDTVPFLRVWATAYYEIVSGLSGMVAAGENAATGAAQVRIAAPR
jgi:hypothetical protein